MVPTVGMTAASKVELCLTDFSSTQNFANFANFRPVATGPTARLFQGVTARLVLK